MAIESLEKLDMSKKIDRFKFTRRIMRDNYTHIDDCNCAIELCTLVDELQARAELAEFDLTMSKEKYKNDISSLRSMYLGCREGRATNEEEAAVLRKLAGVKPSASESALSELSNSELERYAQTSSEEAFKDLIKAEGVIERLTQERDVLAERVKALESVIDYLFSQESLSDSDVREVKRLLKGNANA